MRGTRGGSRARGTREPEKNGDRGPPNRAPRAGGLGKLRHQPRGCEIQKDPPGMGGHRGDTGGTLGETRGTQRGHGRGHWGDTEGTRGGDTGRHWGDPGGNTGDTGEGTVGGNTGNTGEGTRKDTGWTQRGHRRGDTGGNTGDTRAGTLRGNTGDTGEGTLEDTGWTERGHGRTLGGNTGDTREGTLGGKGGHAAGTQGCGDMRGTPGGCSGAQRAHKGNRETQTRNAQNPEMGSQDPQSLVTVSLSPQDTEASVLMGSESSQKP